MYVIKCENKKTGYFNYADYYGDGVDINECEVFDSFDDAEEIVEKYKREDKKENNMDVEYIIEKYDINKDINIVNVDKNLESVEAIKNVVNIESQLETKKQKVLSKEER